MKFKILIPANRCDDAIPPTIQRQLVKLATERRNKLIGQYKIVLPTNLEN